MAIFSFKPQMDISPQFIASVLAGLTTFVGIIATVTTKAFTRSYLTRKEAEKHFADKKLSDEKDKSLGRSVDTLRNQMDTRFTSIDNQMNVIITLIKRNGK